jgi:hypothetical protein
VGQQIARLTRFFGWFCHGVRPLGGRHVCFWAGHGALVYAAKLPPMAAIGDNRMILLPALPAATQAHEVTEEKARILYAEKLKAEAEKNIADFGTVKVLNGRFGPYITDGKKNAKIPKDTDPKSLTEADAKKLLAEAPAKKLRTRGRKK